MPNGSPVASSTLAQPQPPTRDLYAESISRITNGHSGPLYNENGQATGAYIDVNRNVFKPTWGSGPLGARPDLVDQTEIQYMEKAMPKIGWDLNGAMVKDHNNNPLGYHVDRGGSAYYPTNDGSQPYSIANNAFEDHDETWAAANGIKLVPDVPLGQI